MIIGLNSPPVLPVKFEKTYSIREYERYINGNIISAVPRLLFLLNTLPLIYLMPMYIPIMHKESRKSVRIKNGRRPNMFILDVKLKENNKTDEIINKININMDNIRTNIPKFLCFI